MADPGRDQTTHCTANRIMPTSTVLQRRTERNRKGQTFTCIFIHEDNRPLPPESEPRKPEFLQPTYREQRRLQSCSTWRADYRDLSSVHSTGFSACSQALHERSRCGHLRRQLLTAFLPRLLGATYPTARANFPEEQLPVILSRLLSYPHPWSQIPIISHGRGRTQRTSKLQHTEAATCCHDVP